MNIESCHVTPFSLCTCEADLRFGWLWPGTLRVFQRGNRLGELEEDLALDAPFSDALAAPSAAVAPVGDDKTERYDDQSCNFRIRLRRNEIVTEQDTCREERVDIKYSMRIRETESCDTDWASLDGGPCEFILGRFARAGACGRDNKMAQGF